MNGVTSRTRFGGVTTLGCSAVEDGAGNSFSGARVGVEALPALFGTGNPAVAPRPLDVEALPGDLNETATERAAVEALREAVEGANAIHRTIAAAAWHAEAVARFLCTTFGCGVAGVQVMEHGSHGSHRAEVAGDAVVEVSTTVGPEGTCACRGSAGSACAATMAAEARSFETVLTECMAEVGVLASGGVSRR